jgi:competence protein ComEC
MTASKIFLYFCLAFVGGIFLNSIFRMPPFFLLGILIFSLMLISVLWPFDKLRVNENKKKITVLGFCLMFLVLGIWRHQSVESQITKSKLQTNNDSGETIFLTGVISEEPDIRQNSIKLTVDTGQGKVLITTSRYPEYQYGDELKIIGKLKTPAEDIEGFNYREYLSKDGVYSVADWPKIELLAKNKGNFVYQNLFKFKNKLKASANQVMSPPQSGLLEALFFGDEENISQEWKDKFNLTGTRHITAVSGMNITIISALILNFLLALGFWRGQAFYLAVILIILYILMIGAPASALRAGTMGLIFLAAQHFGRVSAASRAVVFASAFMLFLNPLLLLLDVGFQLSFLAIIGLIYLQPMFSDILKKVPDAIQLRSTLAATLSAQIFTLPILIYNFGRLPVTSPLTNILIVPTISFVTISGFIFSLSGLVFYPLGQILSWPAWFLLTYITKVIDFSSKIPFATLEIKDIPWFWLVVFYLILIFFIWRRQESQKLKFLNY